MTSFSGSLITSVEDFHHFEICGKFSRHPESVTIKFSSGLRGEADVPLEIALDHKHNYVILNSYRYDQHDDEGKETFEFRHSPEEFKVYISVNDSKFHVALNDEQLCTYECTVPLKWIKAINIEGDVSEILKVDHRQSHPFPYPHLQERNLVYGFSADVPRSFRIGDRIIVSAIAYSNFTIKMNHGDDQRQMLTIAAQFNGEKGDIDVTSMSAALKWNPKESHRTHLVLKQQFRLEIEFTKNSFLLSIDEHEPLDYKFQCNVSSFLSDMTGVKVAKSHEKSLEIRGISYLKTDGLN